MKVFARKNQKKIKLTLVFFVVYVVTSLVLIFKSHQFNNAALIFTYLLIILEATVIAFIWLGNEIGYSYGLRRLVNAFKLSLIMLPLVLINPFFKKKYEQKMISKYKASGLGIVTQVSEKMIRSEVHTKILVMDIANKLERKKEVKSFKSYKLSIGDTVVIEYSSKIPTIFNIRMSSKVATSKTY